MYGIIIQTSQISPGLTLENQPKGGAAPVEKKRIAIVVLFFLASVLAACAAERKNEAHNEANAPKPETERVIQNVVDKKDEKIILGDVVGSKNSTYQIATETYIVKNGWLDIAIRYPQIVNLGDSERQARINEIIKKAAVPQEFLTRPAGDERRFRLPIEYKITWQGDRLLSIQYSGVGYVKGEPHPNNFFYTTNIDIAKGCKLVLKDLVKIDETFVEILRNENIKTVSPLRGISGKKIFVELKQQNTEDTIELLKKADIVDANGWLPDTYCYFRPDAFGISTGTAHPIGDHGEFEIRYEDIAGNIKAENDIWKDFFTGVGSK